jgi:hypothetical protein
LNISRSTIYRLFDAGELSWGQPSSEGDGNQSAHWPTPLGGYAVRVSGQLPPPRGPQMGITPKMIAWKHRD